MKRFRNALFLSLAVNAYIALAELVFVPLHGAGYAQDVLGYVNGAAQILHLPGMTAAEFSGLRPAHRWTWPGFGLESAVNGIFYAVVFGIAMRMMGGAAEDKEREERSEKREASSEKQLSTFNFQLSTPLSALTTQHSALPSPSRRDLLLNTGRISAGLAAACASWGFFIESRWFETNRWTIPISGLPPELDRFRIVQLSDIHHSSWMSIRWVRQIIDATDALAPDFIALTGDYVHRGPQYMQPVVAELARLLPRCGMAGVMGNHDWWEGGGPRCKEIFAEYRIPLIDNNRIFIAPDRRIVPDARRGLCIAGVGDLWEDKCLYDDALDNIPGGMPRILLSHNPDVAEEPGFLRCGHRVDLMLSGHTHGGQIALPFIGPPVTNSRYGQKYARGLVRGPACPVLISKGLGMTVMPIRLGVRPEIVVIELRAAT